MEAIAAHALAMQRIRNGEAVGHFGMAAVEGGIEAGDLRQIGARGGDGRDGRQIVRLMQRCQRHQPAQPVDDLRVVTRIGAE